jgi:hypothetical protein
MRTKQERQSPAQGRSTRGPLVARPHGHGRAEIAMGVTQGQFAELWKPRKQKPASRGYSTRESYSPRSFYTRLRRCDPHLHLRLIRVNRHKGGGTNNLVAILRPTNVEGSKTCDERWR